MKNEKSPNKELKTRTFFVVGLMTIQLAYAAWQMLTANDSTFWGSHYEYVIFALMVLVYSVPVLFRD
jgi:drug/metabolite transporter superfamily protein YnfA